MRKRVKNDNDSRLLDIKKKKTRIIREKREKTGMIHTLVDKRKREKHEDDTHSGGYERKRKKKHDTHTSEKEKKPE